MIEQIVKYYKTKITAYGLVFKYMKRSYYLMCVSMVFTVIFLFTFVLTLLMNKQYAELLFFEMPTIVILFIFVSIIMKWFNKRAKYVLKDKYEIIVSGKMWRTAEFDQLQIKKLNEYLEKYLH